MRVRSRNPPWWEHHVGKINNSGSASALCPQVFKKMILKTGRPRGSSVADGAREAGSQRCSDEGVGWRGVGRETWSQELTGSTGK